MTAAELAPPPVPPRVATGTDEGERDDALARVVSALLSPGEALFELLRRAYL